MRPGLVAASALYAFVAILLAASLPVRVPLGFGTDLAADRWGSRAEFMLLVCGIGVLVIGLFTALSARSVRLRADLQRLGAVTVAFLAVELAVAYGALGGYDAVGVSYAAAPPAAPPLSSWVVVLLAGYLAYLAGWTVRVLRHGRDRSTADSAP